MSSSCLHVLFPTTLTSVNNLTLVYFFCSIITLSIFIMLHALPDHFNTLLLSLTFILNLVYFLSFLRIEIETSPLTLMFVNWSVCWLAGRSVIISFPFITNLSFFVILPVGPDIFLSIVEGFDSLSVSHAFSVIKMC